MCSLSVSTETLKEDSEKALSSLKDFTENTSCDFVEENGESFLVFTFCVALNLANFETTPTEEIKSEILKNKKQSSKSTNVKKEATATRKISNELCYISCTYCLNEDETTTVEIVMKNDVGFVFSDDQTSVARIWRDRCSSWVSWTCRHKLVRDEESLKSIANREIIFTITNEQDVSNSRVSLEAIERLMKKDAEEIEVLQKEIEKKKSNSEDENAKGKISVEERLNRLKEDQENQAKMQTEMTESRVRLINAILHDVEEDDDNLDVEFIKPHEEKCNKDTLCDSSKKQSDEKPEKKVKECKYQVIKPVLANFYCEKFNKSFFENKNNNEEECANQNTNCIDCCMNADTKGNDESKVFNEVAFIKSRQAYTNILKQVKTRKIILNSPHLLPPHLRTNSKNSVGDNVKNKKNEKSSKKKKSAKKEVTKGSEEEKQYEALDQKEKLSTSMTLAPFYTTNSLFKCVVRRAIKTIDSKVCINVIEDFLFKANLEGKPLLDSNQLCRLNPMLISLTTLHNLPTPCLPLLNAFYKPVFLEYSIFGLKHTTRSFPHFKNTRIDDHFVVFLADVDGGVVKEFCWGKGIEVSIYDRNVRDEMKEWLERDATVYGGTVDDPILNHYFFAHYKRSLKPWEQPIKIAESHRLNNDSVTEKNNKKQKKEQDKKKSNISAKLSNEQGDETNVEGCGKGNLSLHFILKGGTYVDESIHFVSSGNKRSFIERNYLCNDCRLNIKVDMLHPWGPCCDVENPISRFLIHFKSENKNFYTNLLSFVLKYNFTMVQSKCGKKFLQSFMKKEEKIDKEIIDDTEDTKDAGDEVNVYIDGWALINTITARNVDFYRQILDAQSPDGAEENNLDYITGFCVDDGSMGVVILEGGDKDFILHRLRAMVDECCEEEPNLSYNTSITFKQRLYNALNLGLRTLKPHLPLATILSHHLCHLTGTFSPQCYDAIMKLHRLQQTSLLTQVVRHNDFPNASQLLVFCRELCTKEKYTNCG